MRRALIAAAVVAVLVLANTARLELASQAAEADVGRLLELSSATVQVAEGGRFNKQTIVLLHGWGASIKWWRSVAPQLARDHRVIRFDLLGHGGSDKPRRGYSIEEQAGLVAEALQELHADNITLVGHSLGGLVATAVAETDPFGFRGVVLISTPATLRYQDLPLMGRLIFTPVLGHTIYTLTPASIINRAGVAAFSDGIDPPWDLLADITRTTYNSGARANRAGVEYVTSEPGVIGRLRELELPVLVIWGDEDRLWDPASADEFKELRTATVEMVAGAGHSPHVEAPVKIIRLVREFTHADWN